MIVKIFHSIQIPKKLEEIMPSKTRARDFYVSRTALHSAVTELDSTLSPLSLTELTIVNFNYLEKNNNIKVSLSHTGNYGAAVASMSSEVKSVGIDIELVSRKIKPGMAKYIDNELDTELPFIEKWTMKEACFKAAWPLYHAKKEKSLILKDIWIKENSFGLFDDKTIIGKIDLTKTVKYDEEFLVATASI